MPGLEHITNLGREADMFGKLFGARTAANEASAAKQSQDDDRDAAIEQLREAPPAQGLIRAIFLNSEGGELLDAGDFDGAVRCFGPRPRSRQAAG